jgi:hypothetical protein
MVGRILSWLPSIISLESILSKNPFPWSASLACEYDGIYFLWFFYQLVDLGLLERVTIVMKMVNMT